MRINVVCVGKIKEKFYTQAVEEYSKRLSRYCKLDIVELPDEKTPDNASDIVNEQIKNKEGERILSAIKDDAYVCALAIEGKMLDSVELSEKIERLGIEGTSNITFVIGGSLGLAEAPISKTMALPSAGRITAKHRSSHISPVIETSVGIKSSNSET